MSDKPYKIVSMELGPMENFIYLIQDLKSGRAAVVDPAWDVPTILKEAEALGVTITDILLTHSHHDHINGIEQILAHYDAQLHLSRAEAEFWGKHLDLPTLHHGGDIIKLGDTEIQMLHTPGHTPGSACYHLGNDLITGDTMFVYGCGRCDLNGGDPEVMYSTLQKIEHDLPGNTQILPGHNYSIAPTTSLLDQIEGNPFLHFDNKDDFVEYRMHIHDKTRDAPYHPVFK
ncbi:MAG: MBL fold metallo-hydrolase [Thioalkalispiraceae bacterium]|jgi:glyoxylase-like metal-dependent hydrolase (beta-lactamase superfamily II)